MTTNRLAGDGSPRGKVTVESLHDYAAKLNAQPWVARTGGLYFVNKREKTGSTGEIEHFLDRHL